MKLIIISGEQEISGELDIVNHLFQEGMNYFHLRKPYYSEWQMRNYIEQIESKYHPNLILHSHHDLSKVYNLKGIHFNTSWKRDDEKNYEGLHQSSSLHSISEVENCGAYLNYVFLSPVFESISKKGYKSGFEKDTLKGFLKKSPIQVIALGGVDEDKIALTNELGFSGIAVLGALWENNNPIAKFRRIKSVCENA